MKEIIKFRGKRVDTGEWVFGNVIGVDCSYVIAQNMFEWVENSGLQGGDWWHVIPDTVGQYTGLKDKNSKEIYEGDILRHKWNSGNDIFLETISEVKFSRGAFVVDDKKRADWLLSLHALPKWAEIEVIGNIYENPGLLEVE